MSTDETNNKQTHAAHQGRDLTTGSIPRHLLVFSLPMLAGSAVQTLYSFVNAVWVGQGLGKTAMAAIGNSMSVFFLLMSMAFGLTTATSILVSQFYGAKDWQQMRRAVQNSVILTTVVSILCVIIGIVYARPILVYMDTPPNVLQEAVDYLRIFLLGTPFMFGTFMIASMLRGAGDSKTPVYFQAAFLVLTAILDPILMFGWLGLPKLGLNGTAIATIITQAGAVIAISIYLQRKRHIVAPDWAHPQADLPMTWLTVKLGFPTMIQQALVSVAMMLILRLVNQFGENSSSAYAVATRVDQLAFMPAMTIGMAIANLAGQNIGAKRYDRVHDVFKWGLVLSCGLTAVATLLAVGAPGIIMRVFTHDTTVIELGSGYLRVIGFGYVLFAIWFVCNGIINGSGHTMVATAISVIGLWLVRVPFAEYLVHRTHRLESIWHAMLFSFFVGTSVSLIYYFSGLWKKPVIRHTAPPVAEAAELTGYDEIAGAALPEQIGMPELVEVEQPTALPEPSTSMEQLAAPEAAEGEYERASE